ncbi:MAG: hypothetical protein HY814_09135 [Candidatus Riflebacteria bacterium]|nr:hypothetical protein [Candidatus Riflebacteria bacterium]
MIRIRSLALVLVLDVLVCAGSLWATEAYTVRAILQSGGSATVGKEFANHEIQGFISIGHDRVTVKCVGFATYEARSFLSLGARLMVDNSYASWEVSSLCQQGHGRISVVAKGFASYETAQWAQLGATIIDADSGGSHGSLYEQMRILQSGGSVAIDHRFASHEISQLISTGHERVTVICAGFASYEVSAFLAAGARIRVDRSFASYEVSSFCQTGHDRVTVVSGGFSEYELQGFASSGAHIQYDEKTPAAQAGDESRSQALDATIAGYERANDWNRAIETRRQCRNEFGYHKHTIGMARGYRELGDTAQAKRLYQEVATASDADRQYVVEASDGLAELTLPEIDAKISAGNLPAAIASIKAFLDSYPTSKKSDFVRRVADIVDRYAANGQTDQALKLIGGFTSRYTKGSDSELLDAKKVTILEKSGDFNAYQAAVLDFHAKYSGVASDTANNMLVRLIQASERKGGNQANVQALLDKLAASGNAFGLQRHQQAAQAELARIKGLGNKAEISVGLARMATFPSSSYATAKRVIAEARELYLKQYASPWYYDCKRQLEASPESAKRVFGLGLKDAKSHLKHETWQAVFSAVEQREVSAYATWDGAALEKLFDASSSASVAYKSLTDRIAKELAAYNAWQDAGLFKRGGFKKSYLALVGSSPNQAELLKDFLAKAYARGTGGSNSGTTRRETEPSFDGVR